MKKNTILFIFIVCFNTLYAQVLYTETFDNLAIGNLGTDPTGKIPGKGGWYTEIINYDPYVPALPVTNASVQVVSEPNRGHVLQIAGLVDHTERERHVFRNDLKTFWQNRIPGNNVLKLSFDVFTGYDDQRTLLSVTLISDEGTLFSVGFRNGIEGRHLRGSPLHRGDFDWRLRGQWVVQNNQPAQLPLNTWVTLEVYLDYNNAKVYYSVPSLNFIAVKNTIQFDLNNTEYDDGPAKLNIALYKRAAMNSTPYTPKFDNINISAQSTVPTVGINKVAASRFNLYPNPVTHIVTITNNNNMFINHVAVYDIAGKLINTYNFNNKTEIQLNVEDLPMGTYLLHLKTNEGTAIKKMIKK